MKRFVAVHRDDGVFVGMCLGMAFFTLRETAGQTRVTSFDSRQRAFEFLVVDCHLPNAMRYVEVEVANPDGYATVSELRAAGLGDYIGDLDLNVLRHAAPMGHA